MADVLAPFDQLKSPTPTAVNVSNCPAQMEIEPEGEMATWEFPSTTTSCEAAAVQFPLLAVTVYVPAILTVMDEVVAPLDQV